MLAQHDYAYIRMALAQMFCYSHALIRLRRRHADVCHDNLWWICFYRCKQRGWVSIKPDYTNSWRLGKNLRQALANKVAIVGNCHADRRCRKSDIVRTVHRVHEVKRPVLL